MDTIANNTLANEPSLDHDIPCPLCDYNLRGLTEPRCPECGHQFDWNELRDPTRRKHPYLFEHQRRGWRAIASTWFHSLFPRRFWKSVRITHEPNARRMIGYWISVILLGPVFLPLPMVMILPQAYWQVQASRAQWVTLFSRRANPQMINSFVARYGSLQQAAVAVVPFGPNIATIFGAPRNREQLWLTSFAAAEIIILWPILTFASLMLYRQLFRQAKIRPAHVMRVAIYSTDPLMPMLLVGLVVLLTNRSFWFQFSPQMMDFLVNVSALLVVLFVISLVYRVVVAVRLYLRLPLMRGAILTQILVILMLLQLLIVVGEAL